MARKKNDNPWYFKYLRSYLRQIFRWSPERKIALKRAQISRVPELWRCEYCGTQPLTRKEKEVEHIEPCINVNGFDGWTEEIKRTVDVKADGIKITCKPCHHRKSAAENKARRAKSGQSRDTKKDS